MKNLSELKTELPPLKSPYENILTPSLRGPMDSYN